MRICVLSSEPSSHVSKDLQWVTRLFCSGTVCMWFEIIYNFLCFHPLNDLKQHKIDYVWALNEVKWNHALEICVCFNYNFFPTSSLALSPSSSSSSVSGFGIWLNGCRGEKMCHIMLVCNLWSLWLCCMNHTNRVSCLTIPMWLNSRFFFRSFSIKKGVSWTDGNFPCLLAVSYSICKVLLWFSFTHNNGTINSHTWNLRDFNWFMMQQSQPLQEQQDESSSRLGDVSVRICSRLRSTNERRRINRNLSFIWANLRYANICTSINSLWHKSFYYYFGIIIF